VGPLLRITRRLQIFCYKRAGVVLVSRRYLPCTKVQETLLMPQLPVLRSYERAFRARTLVGGWLRLVVAFITDISVSDPPRFPGEDIVAVILASTILAALCALVHRAGGRSARNDLFFAASFAAFVVLFSIDATGMIPLLTPLPALLVALLLALAAVRRSVLLRLAGLFLGSLYALVAVLLSLVSTFG
jgi:hypothetical protein